MEYKQVQDLDLQNSATRFCTFLSLFPPLTCNRHTETHKQTHRDTHTDTHRHIQTDTQRHAETHTNRHTQTDIQRHTKTHDDTKVQGRRRTAAKQVKDLQICFGTLQANLLRDAFFQTHHCNIGAVILGRNTPPHFFIFFTSFLMKL